MPCRRSVGYPSLATIVYLLVHVLSILVVVGRLGRRLHVGRLLHYVELGRLFCGVVVLLFLRPCAGQG